MVLSQKQHTTPTQAFEMAKAVVLCNMHMQYAVSNRIISKASAQEIFKDTFEAPCSNLNKEIYYCEHPMVKLLSLQILIIT